MSAGGTEARGTALLQLPGSKAPFAENHKTTVETGTDSPSCGHSSVLCAAPGSCPCCHQPRTSDGFIVSCEEMAGCDVS